MNSSNNLFYQRLNQAIKKSGKSANQIERELGYARNALHNYKMGSEPSAKRLMELSKYFQLQPEYLLGIELNSITESPLSYFEQLNDRQKLQLMIITQQWWVNIAGESLEKLIL